MITYPNIARRPSVCPSLIGMSLTAFDARYHDFETAHLQRLAHTALTKRGKQPRQRAAGAGRRPTDALPDRLLMALFGLKVYPTYEVLGFFFSLNKTNAEDNIKNVCLTLEARTSFALERPQKERQKQRSVEAVMDAFPDVCLGIDAKAPRIRRPQNKKDEEGNLEDIQKPFYSGKKKGHTRKKEIGVRPNGKVAALFLSVPGGANHDLTLCRQTHSLTLCRQTHSLTLCRQTHSLDKLLPVDPCDEKAHEAARRDKGYEGLANDYPDHRIYQPSKARRGHPSE